MADDAGALLVRSGLVSASALDAARAWVTEHGGTLGEQLVAAGAIADDTLTDFYRSRLLVPQVNPNSLARLPVRVVATIPSDMAIELRAIPVSLDGENNLTVAMSDPSDRHAVDEIAFFTGAYVVRAVATQMQIAWCLAHYYGHVTSLGQRLLQPSGDDTMPNPRPQPEHEPAPPPKRVTPQPVPRTRGLTGKVEATRHRAMPPITGPVDIVRPRSGELDLVAVAAKLEPVPAVSPASARSGKPEPTATAPKSAKPEPTAAGSMPTGLPSLGKTPPTGTAGAAPGGAGSGGSSGAALGRIALSTKQGGTATSGTPASSSTPSGDAKSNTPPKDTASTKSSTPPKGTASKDAWSEPSNDASKNASSAPSKDASSALSKDASSDRSKDVSSDRSKDASSEPSSAANVPVATDAAPTTPMHTPPQPLSDGAVDRPRARSISGEIRVPIRRAPSIRPPMPDPTEPDDGDEAESQVITIEVSDADEDPTGPRKIPGPLPRRKQKPNPPELAERAGEVDIHTGPVTKVDLDEPRIIIAAEELEPPRVPDVSGEIDLRGRGAGNDDAVPPMSTIEITDDTTGVVIHDHMGADSEPVLLERRRRSDPPPVRDATIPTAAPQREEDVVVLDARKAKPTPDRQLRPGKRTQVGMGSMAAYGRAHRDTDASGVPSMMDDVPTGADTAPTDLDPTRVDQRPAPPRLEDTDETLAAPPSPRGIGEDTNPRLAAPPRRGTLPLASAFAPTTIQPRRASSEDDDGDLHGPATTVMSAVELDEAIPGRASEILPGHLERKIDYDPLDDGWGPPGTTIPPPLLGAIPGTDEDDDGPSPTGIPMPDVDAPPLIVAPPSPPEPARGTPQLETAGAPALIKAMEESTSRAIELLRSLERAQERDEVVRLMIAHLAETHRRAGFFSIKPDASKTNELGVFAMVPVPAVLPMSSLRLDRPSTLQDVVGTRLPYRGPMHDDASRTFLTAVLGSCPPEILLVPVAIRERVVGVLFGEHRMRHTFDDQLALAARAAGMALERILKAKRI